MARSDPTVSLSCIIKTETAKAFLIETEDGEEHWIPFSQTKEIHRLTDNGAEYDNIVISEWIAKQKGLA